MGFIESTYVSTLAFIEGVGESEYLALAASLAETAQILSALLIILVLINMGTQTRPMLVSDSLWLIVRFTLIAIFMGSWSLFDDVFQAFNKMFEALGNQLLSASLGANDTTSFARELDNLSAKAGQFANVQAGRLNILGSVMNGIMVVLIGALGAFATLALIISRIVLAVLVGLAPLAIVASMTNVTKSFFSSWLSAVILMLLFPLVLSGVFATILAMGNNTIAGLEADAEMNIGTIIPVVMVLILSIIMVILSPVIVSMVGGSIELGRMTGAVGGMMARAAGTGASLAGRGAVGAGQGAYGAGRGAAGYDAAYGAPASQRAGAAIGGAARDTANFARPSQLGSNLVQAGEHRAAQLNRLSERIERFRKPSR